MAEETHSTESEDQILEEIGHPKGTLAFLGLYMALFIVGWLLFYFVLFIPRGAPMP